MCSEVKESCEVCFYICTYIYFWFALIRRRRRSCEVQKPSECSPLISSWALHSCSNHCPHLAPHTFSQNQEGSSQCSNTEQRELKRFIFHNGSFKKLTSEDNNALPTELISPCMYHVDRSRLFSLIYCWRSLTFTLWDGNKLHSSVALIRGRMETSF